MGSFFGSVHLRTSDRAAVHKALTKIAKKKKARFLMGPVLHGWLPVYPDNSGQDDAMAKAIARGFSCEVLHVLVHDDDIFAYTFFRGGRLVDQFNSQPDYFDEVSARVRKQCRGRPELLADLVPDQSAVSELQELLNEARDAKVFATDSLDHFARLLGLPNAVSSYEYLMAGETADIDGWDQYVHVPDRSAEVARQEQAEAGVVQAKEKLQAAGLLLAEQSAEHPATMAAWCPDREGSGFLVAWINPVNGIGPVPIKHLEPPWALPSNFLRLVVSNNANWLILSPSGRYLASGGSHGMQQWDFESGTLMHEHSWKRAVGWLGFTPDEKHLITVAQQEVAVQSVLTGQQESSFAIPHTDHAGIPNRAAVHPDGQMVIADPAGRLYLVDYLSAKVHKTMYLGGRHVAAEAEAAFVNTYLQQLDVEAMVAKVRANLEQRIHAMEKRQQQTPSAERDAIEGMRRDMEKNLDGLRQRFEQQKKRMANPIDRAKEQAYQMTISADGQWLFCAGSGGLRVYSWKEICATDEPIPAFSIDPEPLERKTLQGTFPVPGFIHALAHDDRANRLLFGGGSGLVHFLDLASGATGVVLDPPGRGPIRELGLSPDRSALLCMCGGKPWEDSGQQVALLQVWNYANLAGRPMAG